GELLGIGSGSAGQTYSVRHQPIVASTGGIDLFLGVEAAEEELGSTIGSRRHGHKSYRIWQETRVFSTAAGAPMHTFLVDRASGVVTFSPALRRVDKDGLLDEHARPLAAVPPEGREIRLWYCTG